ncbi:MAG: hypothetical protein ACHP7A_02700 [Caulobacterales bacterium]|jgi:hypothetical protein
MARRHLGTDYVWEFQTLAEGKDGLQLISFVAAQMTNESDEVFWLRIAAARMDARSCVELAYRISFGRLLLSDGFAPSWGEASIWFAQAAALGDWRGHYHLCLIQLFDLIPDSTKGGVANLYDQAVEAGGLDAEVRLREAFELVGLPAPARRHGIPLTALQPLTKEVPFVAAPSAAFQALKEDLKD